MKKNIIFIGANGAGKTSLSGIMYSNGYHLFKLSPLSDDNEVSVDITEHSYGLVLDRWSPIDLAIYRKDESLLKTVLSKVHTINKHNIIFYLENFNEYDDSYNPHRVVQRPKYDELFQHIQAYRNYVQLMSEAGLTIYHIAVRTDANATLNQIERILKENDSSN